MIIIFGIKTLKPNDFGEDFGKRERKMNFSGRFQVRTSRDLQN